MLVRRLPLITSLCLIASGAFASTALAAHESNNCFDFKPTAAAPGADGRGVSNYLAGAFTDDNELWNSHVAGVTLGARPRHGALRLTSASRRDTNPRRAAAAQRQK
jgi:hypothetical protein